uniref:Uncharacterized protein n=1 Tax=mine drainage metagenome TaxID=410659 RepID=E6PWT1_9ZZZZ
MEVFGRVLTKELLAPFPGIMRVHRNIAYVGDIAGDKGEAADDRCGGEESIHDGPWALC